MGPSLKQLAFVVALSCATPLFASEANAAPTQTAEEKKAAKAFGDGQAAFEQGDFRRAAGLFETAYATKPHHSALWNAAKSWQRAGEDLTAVNLLERYLKEAPLDAANRAEANQALTVIEKRVGRIQLQIVYVADAKLDNVSVKDGLSYVAPGEHVLTADDAGKPVRKVVAVKAGETVSVTLSPAPKEEKPKVIIVEKEKPSGVSPWVVVGGGVLTAGAGACTVIFGLATLQKKDAFLGEKTSTEKFDDANDSQLRTNIALGATIGLAVLTTAVAIFLTNWHGSASEKNAARTASKARIVPGGATF